MTSVVALIPARGQSKRLPGKNTKKLADHPLMAYTIAAAVRAGIFDRVLVCSDSKQIIQMAHDYKVETFLRSPSLDDEADIEWIRPLIAELDPPYDAFAILRPTAPFRSAETIRWAWQMFTMARDFDSLRAVRPVSEHPAKMWQIYDDGHMRTLRPLLLQPAGVPWHSSPSQTLPKIHVQTAGLEIAWTDTVRNTDSIAGSRVLALELSGPEALDVNTEWDWFLCEELIRRGLATLPEV